MGTGIEVLIAVGTVVFGILAYYIKTKITEYMANTRKEIDEVIHNTSEDIKETFANDIVAKLAPVLQKQNDHSKDIDRLKDKSEKNSIDIKALETNVSNLIRSNEKLIDKLDRFFEEKHNK